MSTKTDHHEGPSTLPEPELNPLLNPLLGQHMGRWAEVYFTSPPEKREQAVTELLHELQAENATSEGAALTSATPVQEGAPVPVFEPASEIPQAPVTSVRCHACGWENPASHRFCGMCGTPVAAQSAEDDLPTAEDLQQSEPAFPRNNESPFARSKDAVYEPALSTNELSLFQAGREASDNEDEMFSYSPASRSYRVYVGIALAIVIFALAYMAWRGAQATSQSSHVEPQAPPEVTQPAGPAPTPPSTPTSTSKTDPSEGTPPANEQATAPSDSGRAQVESGRVESTAKASGHKLAHATPPTAPVVETKPSEVSVAGNGDEELAMAQRYLAGGDGLQRNSAEAAKWLWKSLAKQNANATLLLADLYLKGDGVSKNCDQARVLLDSAARSGMKQAGERLRHLEALGCE